LYNKIPTKLKKRLKLPNIDKGIDLIISENNKTWIGVQCKWRSNSNRVNDHGDILKLKNQIEQSRLSYGIFFTNSNKEHPDFPRTNKFNWYTSQKLLRDVNQELFNFIENGKNTILNKARQQGHNKMKE
jgi:hypothetical protein